MGGGLDRPTAWANMREAVPSGRCLHGQGTVRGPWNTWDTLKNHQKENFTWFSHDFNMISTIMKWWKTWLKSFGSLALSLTHFWPISRVVWDVPCLRSGKLKQQLFNIVSTLTWTWQIRISKKMYHFDQLESYVGFTTLAFPTRMSWADLRTGTLINQKFTNARNWFSYRKCFTLIETPLEPGIFQFQLFHTFPLQVALEKHTWQWKIPETPTFSIFLLGIAIVCKVPIGPIGVPKWAVPREVRTAPGCLPHVSARKILRCPRWDLGLRARDRWKNPRRFSAKFPAKLGQESLFFKNKYLIDFV